MECLVADLPLGGGGGDEDEEVVALRRVPV